MLFNPGGSQCSYLVHCMSNSIDSFIPSIQLIYTITILMILNSVKLAIEYACYPTWLGIIGISHNWSCCRIILRKNAVGYQYILCIWRQILYNQFGKMLHILIYQLFIMWYIINHIIPHMAFAVTSFLLIGESLYILLSQIWDFQLRWYIVFS